MGKIFDALEKTNIGTSRSNDSSKPLILTKKKDNVISVSTELAPQPVNHFDPHLITYHYPDSIESDAFKILRTNILFSKDGRKPRTILVTSAMPGEGKSFVSSNLAVSIAQGLDEHVLLMDCDMRKLDIPKRFGLEERPGLSDHLAKGTPLSTLLIRTSVEKLSILTGGKRRVNPTELLSSKKMADLIEEVKNRYADRYIIINSPPPVIAAETVAISKHVDGILFIVKEKGANRKIIKEAIEMVDKEKIIGVVLNWSKRKRHKYYYGYNKYGADNK